MRRISFRSAVFLLAAMSAVPLVSCNRLPAEPPPTGGRPVRLEITAPPEIAPGQSVQFAVHSVTADGTRADVTRHVLWTMAANPALDLSSGGMATGRQPGEAFVVARLEALAATTRVLVLPAGTYRLIGTIYEVGLPLPGVSIQVVEGVGAPMSTVSQQDGRFELYGVAGSVRLLLVKSGYSNATHDVTVSSHQTRDFTLQSTLPGEPYSGTYTLTVTAGAPCFGRPFPDAARRRVYTAHMLQRGSVLSVRLDDADFIVTRGYGNGFKGTQTGGAATFDLTKDSWYYYDGAPEYQLVERLANDLAVVVDGIATVSGSPSVLRGTVGRVSATSYTSAPHDPFFAWCSATFEMERR